MKMRILLIVLYSVFLYLACNTYDPPVVLEYSIGLSAPTTTPIVFKNYTFSIDAGDNKFSSINVYTEPAGFIDSAVMNNTFKNDNTVSGYFLKPGTCKFCVEGITPDQRTIKDSVTLTVRNPYTISGPSQLALQETGSFRLVPADTLANSGLQLRVTWEVNGGTPNQLDTAHPFLYAPLAAGPRKITAILTDIVTNYSFIFDPVELTVPGHRPSIDSVSLVKKDLIAGDNLAFYLKASDNDNTFHTILLTSVKNNITRIDTIPLSASTSYDSLFATQKTFFDTGSFVLTITVADPSGLVSGAMTALFTVTCTPPLVAFVPNDSTMEVPFNYATTLFVTGVAEIYRWRVDGEIFTTTVPQLTQNFLNPLNQKNSATVIVYGIDRFNYNGKPDTVKLYRSNSFYNLSFSHIPGDSAYRDSAYWIVRTPNAVNANANGAKFFWSLFRPAAGDTIYRDSAAASGDSLSRLSLEGLAIPGIDLDSIDCAVSVVLRDALDTLNTSAILTNATVVRPFRPQVRLVSVTPGPDSVSTDMPVTIAFKASDVNANGFISSILWKYADSGSIHTLSSTETALTFVWKTAGACSIHLWAFDNDGQVSDTLKTPITIIKNRPSITGISLHPATAYTSDACSLSADVKKGISGARIDSVRWSCSTWNGPASMMTKGTTIPASFAIPGTHLVTVTVYDSLRDSSSRIDAVSIMSGKPVLTLHTPLPGVDSISTGIPVIFTYSVSTARSCPVDSVFWRQNGLDKLHGLNVTENDSSFTNTWADSGTVVLTIWAQDSLGILSDTITRTLVIVKNRPAVAEFIVPSGTPPCKKLYNYTIVPRRGFSGARIMKYHWVYPAGSGTKDSIRTDATLSLRFDTPGAKIISVYIQDSLNDTSALYTDTVIIDPGIPVVTSVTVDTSASGSSAIYVNDRIGVMVTAKDTNGSVATYRAILRNNANGDSILALGSNPLSITVPVGREGVYSLHVFAIDDDGLPSDAFPATPLTLKVRAAKPVITGFTPPAGMWIYDTLTFRYSAIDTNGGLAKIVFNWGDGSAGDTVPVSPAGDTVHNRAITHRFMSSGPFTVSISPLDEEGQTSVSSYDITIDKGLPHVHSTKDTVVNLITDLDLYIADTLNFAASAADTNGSIVKYIWYLTPPFDAPDPDTLITTANTLTMDRYNNFWDARAGHFKTDTTYMIMVKVLDDDEFTAVDTFYFYNESVGGRAFRGDVRCKNGILHGDGSGGLILDPSWFEYTLDTSTGLDSIQLAWGSSQIPLEAALYHRITLKAIITSGETINGLVYFNDTITIADSVPFLSSMHFAAASGWIGMWRPPRDFFSGYKADSIYRMNFTVEMDLYRRTAVRAYSSSGDFHIENTMW